MLGPRKKAVNVRDQLFYDIEAEPDQTECEPTQIVASSYVALTENLCQTQCENRPVASVHEVHNQRICDEQHVSVHARRCYQHHDRRQQEEPVHADKLRATFRLHSAYEVSGRAEYDARYRTRDIAKEEPQLFLLLPLFLNGF